MNVVKPKAVCPVAIVDQDTLAGSTENLAGE
jgi:hypothetical protein